MYIFIIIICLAMTIYILFPQDNKFQKTLQTSIRKLTLSHKMSSINKIDIPVYYINLDKSIVLSLKIVFKYYN